MKKQKKVLIIALLSTLILIGVVYATFTAITLKINTNATASASIFNVGFDNVAPQIETSNENITVSAITPNNEDKEISLSFDGLKVPGDTATATYVISNNGDVDATNVRILVGPDISGEREWEQNFIPTGIYENELFRFTVGSRFGGNYSGEDYWSQPTTNYEDPKLLAGQKGVIFVECELLQRVDNQTVGGCTVKLIATPGNLSVE